MNTIDREIDQNPQSKIVMTSQKVHLSSVNSLSLKISYNYNLLTSYLTVIKNQLIMFLEDYQFR